jgi:hypothetical protein
MKLAVLALSLLLTCVSSARELEDIKMDDSIQVNGKTLTLNGMGLRRVTKFGIKIKVYVGGLYLEKKSSDSDAIIKSAEVKRFVMEMKQNVDREPMLEAFEKSFTENCTMNCETKLQQFGKFKSHVPSVRKKDRLVFTFLPTSTEFEVIGANSKKVTLEGADLSQNLLALFINKISPPTPELREGLLGK